MVDRVTATAETLELVALLEHKYGPLMFYQSGGCCDGGATLCLPRHELQVGAGDLLLGEVGGHPFYISQSQFDALARTQLVIGVKPGRGGAFSLETPEGRSFHTTERPLEHDPVACAGAAALRP